MKFKLNLPNDSPKPDVVSCVEWSSSHEVISCGDDHEVLKWNVATEEKSVQASLGKDVFTTDMHRFPSTGHGSKKQGQFDLFVVTSTDGKFRLLSASGRIEKTIDAHKGAVISARWSHDGTALVTVGEDGQIKIWSKAGMLRSTLTQMPLPVYAVAWNPDSDQILYTYEKQLVIKSLQPSAKPTSWKAHDGVVLKVDWNPANGLIVSGGEDCKYKVWDSYGRSLFSSTHHDHPITSVSWAPDGDLFAIGSFNTLRLCDKSGWSHSLEKPVCGSILNVSWSNDSTQVACACAQGQVLFAHVINQRYDWKEFEVTLVSRKTVEVRNVTNDARESLDMRDRVIKVSIAYDYLILVTSSQCYIYSTTNFNTPTIFELRESSISLILQSEKQFMLVDSTGVSLYSYEGRMLCVPKLPPTIRASLLSIFSISLSPDVFAVRDHNEPSSVNLFDANTGKLMHDGKPVTHKLDITQICLSQVGPMRDRFLASIDKNSDLYLTPVEKFGSRFSSVKLSTMMNSVCWNDHTNMLCGIQDNKLMIWYYPSVISIDKELMSQTVYEKDISDYGKNPQLHGFIGNTVILRQSNGANTTLSIPPYPAYLHLLVSSNKWEEAIRLCRFVKEPSLWACLSAMSVQKKDLETAEMAYAAIGEADKVEFLHKIQENSNKDVKNAEMSMFCGNIIEAESTLLQAQKFYRAIQLNLDLFKWDRALELAIKHKTHIDTVLWFRENYLDKLGKKESKKMFMDLSSQVEVNWKNIQAKIELDLQN